MSAPADAIRQPQPAGESARPPVLRRTHQSTDSAAEFQQANLPPRRHPTHPPATAVPAEQLYLKPARPLLCSLLKVGSKGNFLSAQVFFTFKF